MVHRAASFRQGRVINIDLPGRLRACLLFVHVGKRGGRERIAPEHKGPISRHTRSLWGMHQLIKYAPLPPMTKFELKADFGAHVTSESQADEEISFQCRANKYSLNSKDPFVIDGTQKGLFTQ